MNASWYRWKPGVAMLLGLLSLCWLALGPLAAEEAESRQFLQLTPWLLKMLRVKTKFRKAMPVRTTSQKAGTEGAPAVAEQQALDAYAQERSCCLQGREAAGRLHYDQGMAAAAEGRLPKAIKELRLAVDYEPGNELLRPQAASGPGLCRCQRQPLRNQHW